MGTFSSQFSEAGPGGWQSGRRAMLGGMEEMVEVRDELGRPLRVVPRSVMRRGNLRHGATGIMAVNSSGQVYVHRRTDTKDVYPGFHDFAAGGVISAGEDPPDSARRELAEELGITGVVLEFMGEADYRDERIDLHAWLYRVRWDSPNVHQPSEVAWGRWMDVEEVQTMIDDPALDVMPDAVALWTAVDWRRGLTG